MKKITFFLESLKKLKMIGTFVPSSRVSAKKMIAPVDFARAKLIVELGGGTGVITKEILNHLRFDAELIVFETHPLFAKSLKDIADNRLTVINDSAEKLGEYLKSRNINKADYIISTLPLATMNKKTAARIIAGVTNALGTQGKYIQIQYSLISKEEIEKNFSVVKLNFTPLNFPPAFFYICEQ